MVVVVVVVVVVVEVVGCYSVPVTSDLVSSLPLHIFHVFIFIKGPRLNRALVLTTSDSEYVATLALILFDICDVGGGLVSGYLLVSREICGLDIVLVRC